VKLPDTQNATVDMGVELGECRDRCFADCSCVAYAAADMRGGGDGTGCVIWGGAILDVRFVAGGQNLYLRLSKSEFGTYRILSTYSSSTAMIPFSFFS
jgi:hypothetical protein